MNDADDADQVENVDDDDYADGRVVISLLKRRKTQSSSSSLCGNLWRDIGHQRHLKHLAYISILYSSSSLFVCGLQFSQGP